jgi:hypothetical protein
MYAACAGRRTGLCISIFFVAQKSISISIPRRLRALILLMNSAFAMKEYVDVLLLEAADFAAHQTAGCGVCS